MKCPFCGKHSNSAVCPFCGVDKRLEARIRHTADAFYRKGYQAAVQKNYYEAAVNLEQALRYDGSNVLTLNLLGLVCWQVGEAGRALRLWQCSIEREKREENRAHFYLKESQRRASQLRAMQESIRLYNEAIVQCRSGSLDYAVARLKKAVSLNKTFVKGYLLLSLCYIEQHHFKKALGILDKVQSLDPMHPQVARYRRIIAAMAEEGHEDAQELDVQDVSQNISIRSSMKEPDMDEIFGSGKNRQVRLRNWHNIFTQIGMFLLGALCCLAFLYTLLFPDTVDTLKNEVQNLKAEMTSLHADKETLQTELLQSQQNLYQAEEAQKEITAKMETLEAELEEALGTVDGGLAEAAAHFLKEAYDACAAVMEQIETENLKEEELILYDLLLAGLADSVGTDVQEEGMQAYYNGEYATAVDKLEKAMEYMEDSEKRYSAMYYLAHSYFMTEEYGKSKELVVQFLEEYEADDELRAMAQQLYYDANYLAG